MKVVYKYTCDSPFTVAITGIPVGKVVHVAAQRPSDTHPTVWVEHAVGEEGFVFDVFAVGTGHQFENEDVEFIGSAVCADGDLVWHLYRTPTRPV